MHSNKLFHPPNHMNPNSQHPTEAKASSVPVEESPFAESKDRDETYEDPESADPGKWVGFSGHRLCMIPIMGGSGWGHKVRKRSNRVTYSISPV
mgnify:CR=1 FL=1